MLSPAGTELLGMLVLAGLALAAGSWITGLFRRTALPAPQAFFYGLNYVLGRILWRAKVDGVLDLASDQGAIIVSNHRCPADPSFLYLTTQRVVHWMVAKEYCVHPAMAWFFRLAESIPVSRGGIDTKATKMAIRYAESGGLVGMFPEGRINNTHELLMPGRPGAALIALRARVPVVPMYIEGSPYNGTIFGSLFMSAKVHLQIGKPVDLSDYYDRVDDRAVHREVTLRLLREIAALAGRPDYQPQVAGKNGKRPLSRQPKEENLR